MHLHEIWTCPCCGILLPCGCPEGDALLYGDDDLWDEYHRTGLMDGMALTADEAEAYALMHDEDFEDIDLD